MTEKKSLGERVTGEGFSKEPLTPEELAKYRQTLNILHSEFLTPSAFIEKVPPMIIARHLALGAMVAAAIFARDNKKLLLAVMGLVGAVNYQVVLEVLEIVFGGTP